MTWLHLSWFHEISQTALAAAVAMLGVVIFLELHSIRLLRRAMDAHLGRVFEQLDLLRFDQQPVEVSSSELAAAKRTVAPAVAVTPASASAPAPTPPSGGNAYAAAAALAATGMRAEDIAQRCGLAAGEARLLTALAAAKGGRRVGA